MLKQTILFLSRYHTRRHLILYKRYFYDSKTKHDTIYAPLTTINSNKGSPIGLIRVSGSKTEHVLKQLTKGRTVIRREEDRKLYLDVNNLKLIEPRKATLAKIYNSHDECVELLDICLLLWFPSPNSYTGEDSCEFHLHGSHSIMTGLLSVLGSIQGLRPAEPGEFTRRAVENKKMSLIEAESLPELLASKTAFQRRLALKGLSGSTRDKYNVWMSKLVDILAHLEASIDFGEDELIGEEEVVNDCLLKIASIDEKISSFIENSSRSRNFIQTGARISILGKPNSGKSTFMNLLCKSDKSIVSDLSGTTRDVIEHSFELGGHAITLCDTAGLKQFKRFDKSIVEESYRDVNILEKHDSIEREGIRRALETAKESKMIVYLIEAPRLAECGDFNDVVNKISKEIETIIEIIKDNCKCLHLVISKIDLSKELEQTINCDNLVKELSDRCMPTKDIELRVDFISCKSMQNFELFSNQLIEHLNKLISSTTTTRVDNLKIDDYDSLNFVNERHLSLLKSVQRHLNQASKLNLSSVEEMAQHVRESLDYLSRIVGSVTNEDVINVIFRDFCIGK